MTGSGTAPPGTDAVTPVELTALLDRLAPADRERWTDLAAAAGTSGPRRGVIWSRHAASGYREPLVLVSDGRLPQWRASETEAGWVEALRARARVAERQTGSACALLFARVGDEVTVFAQVPLRLPAPAALEVAAELLDHDDATGDRAVAGLSVDDLLAALHPPPSVDDADVVGRGLGVAPGIGAGPVAFTPAAALAAAAAGTPAVLLVRLTYPEDLEAMLAAAAVVTLEGTPTAHAAVVARGTETPCVVAIGGALDGATTSYRGRSGQVVFAGDRIVVDGRSGLISVGQAEADPAGRAQADEGRPEKTAALAQRVLIGAAARAGLDVQVNAESPAAVARGLAIGASGVGLCRTEHMFLGDRTALLRRAMLAPPGSLGLTWQREFLRLQREDFVALFTVADGRPVTVRLLDPPRSEFLPRAR